MNGSSFLKNKVLFSPLASQSSLRPQSGRGKRNMSSGLLLTSLVDAFSILVIFLMMSSATEQSDFQASNVQLPKASEAQVTIKTAVVRLHGKELFVNDQPVKSEGLAASLRQIHDQLKSVGSTSAESLVIIADRDQDFATLNPIIVAGSRVGFSEFKFAVERSDK
jgi:biopolymer transport protein ExbD